MTVYIVETSEYSDRRISAVFPTSEAAEVYATHTDGKVSPWEVDVVDYSNCIRGMPIFYRSIDNPPKYYAEQGNL